MLRLGPLIDLLRQLPVGGRYCFIGTKWGTTAFAEERLSRDLVATLCAFRRKAHEFSNILHYRKCKQLLCYNDSKCADVRHRPRYVPTKNWSINGSTRTRSFHGVICAR